MTDKRTLKTIAAIDRAGYAMLAQGGFAQLSVQAWCVAAHITRPTFYSYYLDKNDWLERQIDGAMRLLVPALTGTRAELVARLTTAAWPLRAPLVALLAIHEADLDLQAALAAQLRQTLAAGSAVSEYRISAAAASIVHGLHWTLTHGQDTDSLQWQQWLVDELTEDN
ncbi:hypothetical protein [Lacticaseibacillus daqingensis]|uniref:hypothetical protein n=1 Tax=Lacticaseibacillus daqingensis TaxID=2486014 RepID=UPI000F785C0A|nr:hypothetical protein [Lacticaseibacillus daqingensis]